MMRLALMAAACALAACSAHHTDQDTAPASGPDAAVEVRNLDFPDMTLYVLGATSSPVRLGVVNGNSTQVLTLPSYSYVAGTG
jgi:hypothetical protein